jgi:hypothetical protein
MTTKREQIWKDIKGFGIPLLLLFYVIFSFYLLYVIESQNAEIEEHKEEAEYWETENSKSETRYRNMISRLAPEREGFEFHSVKIINNSIYFQYVDTHGNTLPILVSHGVKVGYLEVTLWDSNTYGDIRLIAVIIDDIQVLNTTYLWEQTIYDEMHTFSWEDDRINPNSNITIRIWDDDPPYRDSGYFTTFTVTAI